MSAIALQDYKLIFLMILCYAMSKCSNFQFPHRLFIKFLQMGPITQIAFLINEVSSFFNKQKNSFQPKQSTDKFQLLRPISWFQCFRLEIGRLIVIILIVIICPKTRSIQISFYATRTIKKIIKLNFNDETTLKNLLSAFETKNRDLSLFKSLGKYNCPPTLIMILRQIRQRRQVITVYYSLSNSLRANEVAFGFVHGRDCLLLLHNFFNFIIDQYTKLNGQPPSLAIFCMNFAVPGLKQFLMKEEKKFEEERDGVRSVFLLNCDEHYIEQCQKGAIVQEERNEFGFSNLQSNSSLTTLEASQKVKTFLDRSKEMIDQTEKKMTTCKVFALPDSIILNGQEAEDSYEAMYTETKEEGSNSDEIEDAQESNGQI